MNIAITGGSGFIGTELGTALLKGGHNVHVLDKVKPSYTLDFTLMDLEKDEIPVKMLEEADVVVNLAGKSIYTRWNDDSKQEIRSSRVKSTTNLVKSMSRCMKPPVLVSASAVGYYGGRGEDRLTEDSAPGKGFLSSLVVDWENEAMKAEKFGTRVVLIRTAPVLGKSGMLGTMLPWFRLALGGNIGGGEQWFPWIHVSDLVSIYERACINYDMVGPFNACSPQETRFKGFVSLLSDALSRPAFFTVPVFALRIRFGGLADEITASQRVHPEKLLDMDHEFKFEDLNEALLSILKDENA